MGTVESPLSAREKGCAGSSLRLADRLALRPAEAAAALGLSERAFRSLLPRLPHVRAGSAVLVPVDALRRWLDQEAKARAVEKRARIESVVREGLSKLTGSE
jgi:hypothetical protein